jgi:MFS family permease
MIHLQHLAGHAHDRAEVRGGSAMGGSRVYVPPVVLCGGLILALCLGVRHSFGLFLPAMTEAHGWGRATFSFALAIQNIVWGLSQPAFGALADRSGVGRALGAGTACFVAGLVLMPWSATPVTIGLSAGVLVGLGLGGTGFAVVNGAISRSVPAGEQGRALGVSGALGSVGQFVIMPGALALITVLGWERALLALAAAALLMAPLAAGVTRGAGRAAGPVGDAGSLGQVLRVAAGHRGFWLLNLGFVVCGFQLAFITNHLPAFLVDSGLAVTVGMTALAIIGATNVLGTFTWGTLGDRWRPKHLLSTLYFLRAAATVAYVALPVTAASTLAYGVAMGLTWLGTVPLTSAVLVQIFGARYLATLFGMVFLGHQVGGFCGVWLAGALFDTTQSYQLVWFVSIALGVVSTVVHLPIDDRAIALGPRPARPATA